MRRFYKISFFFIATILFSNCSKMTDGFSDLDTSLDYTPLFSEDDVSISTTAVELSDGDWIFKQVYEGSTHSPIETTYTLGTDTLNYSFVSLKSVNVQELTVTKGFKITTSSNKKYETGMDENNKEKYDRFAKAHGESLIWDGTTLIQEYSYSRAMIDDYNVTTAINLAKASYGSAKRNGSCTRYIIKSEFGNEIYYFAKK